MSFFEDVKYWVGEQILRMEIRRAREHKERRLSLKNVSSIGIVLTVLNKKDIEMAQKILQSFPNISRVDIKILGVSIAQDKVQTTSPHWDVIDKTNMEWYCIPKQSRIEYFLRSEFDLLICLNTQKNLAVDYIANKTQAKVKLGQYSSRAEKIFDVMFPSTEATPTIQELTSSINTFLTKIP